MIPMSWYLVIAAALFCVGLFGVLSRRNAVGILIGVELMLNAVNINLLTFWHYYIQVNAEPPLNALVFTAIVFIVAAAETAIGLALIINAYRQRSTVIANDLNLLKG
ncbi:MAG TPA: NADH-quinone oxidoreductase subunit NuoK [Anaerolineaceae bacterium]|nr:NADH-quinone oxidoreductase subunit NuoK [Anaerolineaceae bacterium]HNZ12293.1 NADH-quinone oxidoreductase subunit NuoK [Anaerolineaceae bacterium]HOG78512.1 NADH-quinone oxidoreductase subunit NuoK [Anaerolineaceae bacterium]HQF61912.1 NADH-quinone oxidoreductase subunit NuoK [Anaerolineaceae bacterium]HQH84904.1 NADH-quinone oxidoreductase subunit NuoK [Anaerolineaceae bacterium]